MTKSCYLQYYIWKGFIFGSQESVEECCIEVKYKNKFGLFNNLGVRFDIEFYILKNDLINLSKTLIMSCKRNGKF